MNAGQQPDVSAPRIEDNPIGYSRSDSHRDNTMAWFTLLFIAAVIASTVLELWLSARQIAAVVHHRDSVPEPFLDSVSAEDHTKAADYTIEKVRFERIGLALNAAVTLTLTVGGGIAAIDTL